MTHRVSFVHCTAWLLAGAFFSGAVASAAAPQLAKITPRGAQRGTEVEITLTGARLEDAQQLMIYEPGLEVAELTVVDGANVKVKLRIAPDCALGTKHIRIRAASGVSDMRTFRVGALPAAAEVEPNSEFVKPQPVPLNSTVEGTITNEDVDYFVVEAKKGERITAEVEAIRLGDSMFDVFVAIFNEERFELSTSDDAALVYQDGIASIVAPADGKYIVAVRESSYGAGNSYRCHIGTYPRPTAVVPAGGKPGETVQVKFLGDVTGEMTKSIQLPATTDSEIAIFAEDEKGISPSGLKFRLSTLDNVVEQEPNDAFAQGTKGPANAAFNGILQAKGDVDYFGFTATKGQVFDIHVYGRRLRSEIDPVLYVHNAQGGNLAGNDDTGGPDSYLRFTVPADGEHFLSVRDHLGGGGPGFHYRVELTPVAPSLAMTVNEFVQYVEPKLVVPQGNRFPVLITATRRDFGGPLEFLGENLPPGVTVESFALPADQAVAQVMLVAAPDAPVGGQFGQLVGKLADPNQPMLQVAGLTKQDCIMVRGQNQIPFFVEPIPSLAMVVAQKAPFTLQIVEPKAPLVQNGQMKLKVVATRDEGFTAPIKVEVLLNPPGVNSSREVSIAEGQTEALIDMNAAGNAQVKEHKLAIRGEATVGNGPVMVASPFATLKVAEPYVKLAFQQAAVEQGKETELVVNVETAHPYEGNAQVALIGLPNKVTTAPLEINKEGKELVFKVKAEGDAPVGTNKSLFCQVTVTEQGEPVIHNLGTGQIRVDQPLPPKATPAPMPQAAAAPPPTDAPPKRLTRLEQLRLEAKQRLEAQNAPVPEAKPAGGN
jgi:hypothetical protein